MAKLNRPAEGKKEYTAEGGPAYAHMTPMQALRRSVASCLLWEDEFYEDGVKIADRIFALALTVKPAELAALAIEAREQFNLRHVPLLLLHALVQTAKGTSLAGDTIARVIQRADELSEFLAIYWRDGKKPLAAQVKRGLGEAFTKFGPYALAKYNRDAKVKLRDVLFLTHAKPKDEAQAALWKKLVDGTLESPDTWEVSLSAGADKKETFERLIREGKLGYLALLRNLRNMMQAGVDDALVREAILARKGGAERVLPFRYVAAARAAPVYERELDQALVASIAELPPLSGPTVVLVDVSGSMDAPLSAKSDLRRIDAAAALAAIAPAERLRVFTFSEQLVEVPPRRGMAGVDAVIRSQHHSGTYLGRALSELSAKANYERLIVITDEQSADAARLHVSGKHYLINVASNRNGVGYGNGWTHIDGFSESVLRFIVESEKRDD